MHLIFNTHVAGRDLLHTGKHVSVYRPSHDFHISSKVHIYVLKMDVLY
jgi:hypothetical protein